MQANVVTIGSADELIQVRDKWDCLWEQSSCTDPTGRAEPISLWLKHFAGKRRFYAVAIESEGQFLAALPLVEDIKFKFIRVGVLPNNAWGLGASLLIDLRADVDSLAQQLLAALQSAPWKIVLLEHVRLERPDFRAFRSALERRRDQFSLSEQPAIGVIPTTDDWQIFASRLSKSRQRKLRSLETKTLKSYNWEYRNFKADSADSIDSAIREAFALEDCSWKNSTSSSVYQRGVLPYYQELAAYFWASRELGLFFLELDRQQVAFQFGFVAKNTFHSYKVGYDPEFRRLGPGVFLWYLMLREFCGDETIHQFDCIGDANETTQIWDPKLERTGQLLIGLGGGIHQVLVMFHKQGWHRITKSGRIAQATTEE